MAFEQPADVSAEGPSFRKLFEAEFSYVFNTLYRLGARRADLEDLTHEVFIVVHRNLSSYDPRRPLRPWLFGIAFRVAAAHRRRARYTREVPGYSAPEPADQAPRADDRIAAEESRRLVIEALEDVELDRRAVLILHDIDEQPIPEIAHALSIPVGTAYSRLRLARDDLKSAIRRRMLRGGAP